MSTVTIPSSPEFPELARVYTPEDLLTMPDGHRFELVDGQLVERNMGSKSSIVATRTFRILGPYVDARQDGKLFGSDCGYQIFPDSPRKVRFPDGSLVKLERLPDRQIPDGHMRIAPDLAFEVVSPNDLAHEIDRKRLDYRGAGVKLLWIIYPDTRAVHVHRQSGPPTILGPTDELTDEDVLPGFVCKVSDLFVDLETA